VIGSVEDDDEIGGDTKKKKTTRRRKPLSLLHDYHDIDTGLCGEGVWHNSMLGIALVKASRRLRTEEEGEDGGGIFEEAAAAAKLADEYRGWARRLATNLYELNYSDSERGGFRRRTASGIWGSAVGDGDVEAAREDGEFYEPSRDRRCISNAAAVLFLSYLREDFPDDDEVESMSERSSGAFLEHFFDRESGRFRYEAGGGDDDGAASIWRSSDQAMGVLACLRLMQGIQRRAAMVDDDENEDKGGGGNGDGSGSISPRRNRKLVETRTMAASAAERLMDDFYYGPYATEGLIPPVNAIGATDAASTPRRRSRNSWHDSIATFAILASNATSGRESPVGLCKFMARDYGIVSSSSSSLSSSDAEDDDDDEGEEGERRRRLLLLAHDVQEERHRDGPNAYSCTQAIWDACRRAVMVGVNSDDGIAGFDDFTAGLRNFHEETSVREGTAEGDAGIGAGADADAAPAAALATVGTSYPMVRLWANTELAAWLLIDPADFAI